MRTSDNRFVIVLSLCLAIGGLVIIQESAGADPNMLVFKPPPPKSTDLYKALPEQLFSPSVSQLFYDTAYEITHRESITDAEAEQAIVLLNAASTIDASSGSAVGDILKIASRPGPPRHLRMLYDSLVKYVDKNADCLVASNVIRYLLEQLDSRQQKETLLARLTRDIGESNLTIKSDIATELGLMLAEKTDNADAAKTMAMAYTWNKYNQLAFEKLVELIPEQISPALNLEYLRLKLRKNPFDIDTALAFAQYAQKLQLWEVAAGGYQYSADLFQYLYHGQDVPVAIYTNSIICNYNSPRNQPRCLQLAEEFRKQNRFDLQIEAITAKAAAKTVDKDTADSILNFAEKKALQLAAGSSQPANYETLAWFYCFIRQDPNLALDWANKAYAAEPNSPEAAGLLACAFAANNQTDAAKPLVDNYPQTQFATFAKAQIQLAAGQKQPAIDLLRATIDKDPGSIVAEQANQLLTEQKTEYIPVFDTTLILATLKQSIGEQIIPQFVRPDQMLSLQLTIRGNRFTYGYDFGGVVSITNNWHEPLVIAQDSICKGQIRIDANVSGDMNQRFEKLVVTTMRPALPIEPGRNLLIPVRLCTGPLKSLLTSHPQAALNIQFTAYLDPIVTTEGKIVNASAIPGVKPAIVQIERPRVEITQDFLQNRLNLVSKGRQGPKIRAAQLFAGLLIENREIANLQQPPYKLVGGTWMTPMLKSALVYGLTDDDWVVKIHAMAAIATLPLDYELTNAIADGLNDRHWPARMTAVWLLSQKEGSAFANVLDHTAQYDGSELVRNMAVALGAKAPEPNQPIEQPFLDLLRQDPNADSNNIPSFLSRR